MTNNWEQRDGNLTFKDEGGQTMNAIYFKNAYCVNYVQVVSATGSQSLVTKLAITASKIEQNGIEVDNYWIKE